ncbi:hypothetical protein HDK77DRAFT_217526 [Phyllosticta capitalensis]|uniref:Uncharacterized protein n=1 Tax=Phyllosticta capitalensis TaxID=121624 RepID=A0ABR1Z4I1_9PEZI
MLRNITNVAQISTNATYKLVNSWNLAPLSINPAKPQLQLHTAKQDEGLAFKFRNSEETGFVNICAAYQNQTWCLDVFGDNKTTPRLSPWGFYSGQYWVVTPVNGMIKLANQLTGLDYFLDVFDGSNETFMSTGDDYAGQYWMLDHVADNVTLPPNAAENSPISSPPEEKHTHDNISHAAIIGITVSATTAAILVIVGIVLCCVRYRRRWRRPRGHGRPAPKISTNMVQKNLRTTDSDVNLTRLSPLPSGIPSSLNTSTPSAAPTPDLRLAHELESPQTGTIPRSSIYELPSENIGFHGDTIEEADLAEASPSSPPRIPPVEEKAAIFMSSPPPPSVPSSQASARGHARWEEIVPDGNGEITLDGATLRPEFFTNHSLFREEDGAIRRRPDIPGMGNLRGIAYGFGGGGGMAGSVAPGFAGSAASIMARKASESSRTRGTGDGAGTGGEASHHNTLHGTHSSQPPAYDGPTAAFEADSKSIVELPAPDLERKILEWGRRSG